MDYLSFFRDVAFPIAIAGYLLVSIAPRLEALRADNSRIITLLVAVLMELGKREEAERLMRESAAPQVPR